MRDLIPLLQIQDLVWLAGLVLAGLLTAVQAWSRRYNPWTFILTQIGRGINKEVIDKLDEHEVKITELIKKDEAQDRQTAKENALAARRRILRFADEIRRREKHSAEYFDDIIEDINNYQTYCNEHPRFKNDKAVMSIELIEDVWKKCLKEDDFL